MKSYSSKSVILKHCRMVMTEREEEVLVQELALLAANKPLVYDRHFYMPVPPQH